MTQDELEGQLMATQAAIRALIKLQPDPRLAALSVDRELELLISKALTTTNGEGFLAGLQRAKQLVLPKFGRGA